jgi:hypothetical protein
MTLGHHTASHSRRAHANIRARRFLWLELSAAWFASRHYALGQARDPLIPHRPPGARHGGRVAEPFVGIGRKVWVLPMTRMGAPVNGHLQLKSLARSSCGLECSGTHARTHSLTCFGGRGPDLSRTDRSRRLVSGRASRLATLIPPARNGLRIGRTHLSFGSFSKHCSGHVHPSSEASTPLKPSTPRLREPVPSRQTATGPPPACAPRPRSRCASGAPWRS